MYYCDKLVVLQLYDVSHLHIHPFLAYQSERERHIILITISCNTKGVCIIRFYLTQHKL